MSKIPTSMRICCTDPSCDLCGGSGFVSDEQAEELFNVLSAMDSDDMLAEPDCIKCGGYHSPRIECRRPSDEADAHSNYGLL